MDLAAFIERYDRARTALAAAEDGLEADDRLGDLTAAEREIRALVARRTGPSAIQSATSSGPVSGLL